jgi:hypothetical protein
MKRPSPAASARYSGQCSGNRLLPALLQKPAHAALELGQAREILELDHLDREERHESDERPHLPGDSRSARDPVPAVAPVRRGSLQ